MDALMLSRIQFAFTIGFHFIFVPISIGLVLMVVLAERRYYKSGIPADKAASNFWIKLFTTTFAIGVATGLTMEFAFGTNWADYSRFVGNIFGAPLAAEGLFAFFLESTFLGVLLFGRKKVSRGFYYVSTWLVMIGAILSALWILIANSWQQTPAGYKVEGGSAVLTDFWAAAFNPSTAPRFVHTVAGAVIAGCFVVAGISAWYLLKERHLHFARRILVTGARRRPRRLGRDAVHRPLARARGGRAPARQDGRLREPSTTREDERRSMARRLGEQAAPTASPRDRGLAIPSGLSLMLGLSPDAEVDRASTACRPPTGRPCSSPSRATTS